MLRAAAVLREAALDVRIERLRVVEPVLRGEDHFRAARRKLAAHVRRAGLHEHRMPLRRARDVQRAAHAEVRPVMIEHVQLAMIEMQAGRLVLDECVVLPAVPEPGHDALELVGARVAIGVREVGRRAEVRRFVGHHRRDEIPPGATAAQVVERRELAGDVVRRVVGRRRGRDQADAMRDGRQRGEQRERLERIGARAAAQRIDVAALCGDDVRDEQRIELAALGRLRHPAEMREVAVAVRLRERMAPADHVAAAAVEHRVEFQGVGAARHSAGLLNTCRSRARRRCAARRPRRRWCRAGRSSSSGRTGG